MTKGYFGIGIENGKTTQNVGTLWRTAYNMDASFIFTIGNRYRRQASDTTRTPKHVPLFSYATFDEFYANLPYDCMLIGVEFPHASATPLGRFTHPERCVYLLGAEDNGLTVKAQKKCHRIVYIPSVIATQSLNVSVAGSIIMYDRMTKTTQIQDVA